MPRFDTLDGWLQWQESLHPRTIDLGLERATRVFGKLKTDKSAPLTITVAGTNGKGSCIAFLEAIYRAQGYRVGSYTSPHLLRYNERIRINGQPVSEALICQSFERIDEARQQTTLSYFEFSTLAALDIFARADLDIQLLEVGLGGRLDAVNIIDTDLAVVTTICIDHVDWLGETREAIGREKAGIFRPATPVVVGDREPPQSLLEVARNIHAPLHRIGVDFDYQRLKNDWVWQFNAQQKESLPLPALPGEHQLGNASTVITAVEVLKPRIPVSDSAIRQGLQQASLPGRFQFIEGEIPILLDVAHNPQAVKTLKTYIQQSFGQTTIHAVFSMMQDKDIIQVVDIIKDQVTDWTLAPLNNPRAASEDVMLEHFRQCQVKSVSAGFNHFAEAFEHAQSHAKPGDLILVFGSFFLVSEFLSYYQAGNVTSRR
jgi:dihydrofolate synthase/folylpolyglutamate synthase